MGMKAPVTGNGDAAPREIPPEGNYLAVCNGVFMLGTQPGMQGGDPRLQVMLSFELHKRKGPATDSQGRVFTTDAIMNFTFNIKSTLVRYAGALRGQAFTEEELEREKAEGGFDVEKLLGASCRLTVKHEKKADGSTREKIESVSRLDPEDDTPPKGETDEVYWDWTTGAEPPRRISYFWDRAAENPNRKKEPMAPQALPAVPSMVASATDADCPF
jgi:hypothetical protein